MDQQRTGNVSPGAVLVLLLVLVLGGVLAVANLLVAGLTAMGPDSCGAASCSGSPFFAKIFMGIAAVTAVSTLATAFTLRPARFKLRCVLVAMALAGPVLADAVAFAAAPEWL